MREPKYLLPHLPVLRSAHVIAVDLETTGLDPHLSSIRLIQLAVEGMPVLVVDAPAFLREAEGLALLREVFQGEGIKVFQNAKFDLQFLIPLSIYPRPVFDTMLAARLLYEPGMPRSVSLAAVADYYLGETLNKQEQRGDWAAQTLTPAQIEYAARDAAILLRLRHALISRIMEAGVGKAAEIEFACVRAVAEMEFHGIYLDTPMWRTLAERTSAARDAALESLYAYTGKPTVQTTLFGEEKVMGFNLDSNPYVLTLLHRNGISVQSTSASDLYPYRAHPLAQALTAYRKAQKSLSAILEPIAAAVHPATGRLHPHYGQIAAFTGRMSCGTPNIQQIPRDPAFRACFCAPQSRCLVIADYSQIELRVAAQISGDSRMITAYREGEDLHRVTASLMTGKPVGQVTKQERQAAKAVNFGLIYGMGAVGLQQYARQTYGVEMTAEQAGLFRSRFFTAYRGIASWHQRLKDYPSKEGRTLTGRRFAFTETPSLPLLSNSPVQGTAADIIKKALGHLSHQLEGADTWIVGVVHDEILLECPAEKAPETAALLKETMEKAANGILPMVPSVVEAKISASWAEK